MKKAFTLSEILVSLAVISAILLILFSVLRVKPNSNMVLFRKAYNIASNTIFDMLQTGAYYESGSLANVSATPQKIEGENPAGASKFCKVFASFVNTAGDVNCDKTSSNPSFSTLDGIDWYLPPKTTAGTFASKEKIKVDVNGKVNIPNCEEGTPNCENPDIFVIEVSETGKISIPGEIAKQYLQNAKKISK